MPPCRNNVLALSRDFEVNGTFRMNRQARSWDHLTTILILLPTQSEMLPSGFFRSPRATGTHFGRGKRREKNGQQSQDLILPSTGVWSKCGFQQCWEFIFIRFTYMWCCLRRISQLIGNFFLKFQWRKWFSDSLTKYSLNICYVSGIMLFWGIQRLINKAWLSEIWVDKKRCINNLQNNPMGAMRRETKKLLGLYLERIKLMLILALKTEIVESWDWPATHKSLIPII